MCGVRDADSICYEVIFIRESYILSDVVRNSLRNTKGGDCLYQGIPLPHLLP